jgi:hypothetical protein
VKKQGTSDAGCSGQNRTIVQGVLLPKIKLLPSLSALAHFPRFAILNFQPSGYTDTAAMPPVGQSALWKYKGIYLQADQRVGQWSDVVSIPVAG